jgi:hypothetical protein
VQMKHDTGRMGRFSRWRMRRMYKFISGSALGY